MNVRWWSECDVLARAPESLSSVPENLSLEISLAAIILYVLKSTFPQMPAGWGISHCVDWTEENFIHLSFHWEIILPYFKYKHNNDWDSLLINSIYGFNVML